MRISVRTSILVVLLFLVLICSTTLITIFYFNSRISVHFILKDLMQNISAHMADKCMHYLDNAETASKLSKHLATSRVVQTQNQTLLLKYFQQLLQVNKQFAMVYFADVNGNFVMYKRMADGSFSTKIVRRKKNVVYSYWKHENKKWLTTYPNMQESHTKAYDPRKRSWYAEAKKLKKMSWTNVYLFYSDQSPGISCSTPIYDKNQKLKGVVSIDISISHFSYFLGKLSIGNNGKAFILNKNNEIIALPAKTKEDILALSQKYQKNGKTFYRLCPLEESSSDILRKFFSSLKEKAKKNNTLQDRLEKLFKKASSKRGKKYKSTIQSNKLSSEEVISISFTYEDKNYIAMYTPFAKNINWDWKIVVISPEVDFMGIVHWTNNISFIIAGFCVLIAVIISVFFSTRLSKSLENLEKEMNKVKHLELDSNNHLRSRILEVDRMVLSFEKMKSGLRSFKKYVPADIVHNLIKAEKEATLGGEKREVTIFFSDVVGFTSIAEKVHTEELLEHLSEYLECASKIIHANNGTVDKYIGDAIMAFWGAPNEEKRHAFLACNAALSSQEEILKMSQKWQKQGKPIWNVRIGINTGEAIVGNMGCHNRMDYTAVGDCVNLASRLEGLNKYYMSKIIIGENTYKIVKNHFEMRLLDFVVVKGKTETVAIYELIAIKGKVSEQQKKIIDIFNMAILDYRQKLWDKAIKKLEEILSIDGQDAASVIIIKRCKFYKENPPGKNWNGAFSWNEK